MKISEIYTEISVKGMGRFKSSIAGIKTLSRAAGRSIELMSSAGAIGFAALGAAAYFSAKAAEEQERAMAKLRAVLLSTGNASGFTSEQLRQQAEELQSLTAVGDDTIINMQAVLATFKEVRGDEFVRAQKAIMDMSTVLDQDLKSSAVQVGKALNDPIKGLTAMQRVGVTFSESQSEAIKSLAEMGRTAEAQKLILAELESQFGGTAEAAAGTFGGQLKLLWLDLSDIAEVIGSEVGGAIVSLVKLFRALIPPQEELIFWITKVSMTLKNAVKFWIEVYAQFETVWKNLGAVVGNVFDSVKLVIMTFAKDLQFFFTEQIPQYFENFINAAASIPERLKMAMKGEIGFDEILAPFDEMPEVAERQASAAEKALASKIINMWDKLDKESKARADDILKMMGMEGVTPQEGSLKQEIANLKEGVERAGPAKKKEKEKDPTFVGVAEMAKKLQLSVLKKEEDKAQRTRILQLETQKAIAAESIKTTKALQNLKPAGMGA